ncbi:hypothetical protein C8R44DRAFT_728173 [Mycena epipterygia]|nr:hypothetical protein C8R44DRAFT_728173 [Mycena epipterygia]
MCDHNTESHSSGLEDIPPAASSKFTLQPESVKSEDLPLWSEVLNALSVKLEMKVTKKDKLDSVKKLATMALGDYPDECTTDPDDLLMMVPPKYQLQGISLAKTPEPYSIRH